MVKFEVVTIEPQHAAVVRAEVPMEELPGVFDRAFGAVMAVAEAQGLSLTGPPFGYYPWMPSTTVEVAAGFPVSAPVTPAGDVTALDLPGGRVIAAVHVGPYDSMEQTYRELVEWASSEGLDLAEGMWESYLTDPAAEPEPSRWQTAITWPVR